MKKGFLTYIFLIAICLTACSTKAPPAEDRLPLWESKVDSSKSSAIQEAVEKEKNKEMLKKSILQVQTDARLGSGVLWEKLEEEWIVLTAAHVVDGLQEVDVYLVPEEKILPATVELVNGLDLAFLRVSVALLDEKLEEEYRAVIQAQDAIEDGTTIYTRGYNSYGELCEFPGKVLEDWIYVEDFDNYMLLCDCKAEAGMSGGAVMAEDGKLVGLVCGENEKGLLAVLPVGVIQSEYHLFPKN